MSRLLVLAPLLIWLTRPVWASGDRPGVAAGAMVGGLIVIVAVSVYAARRRRANAVLRLARRVPVLLICGWFAACVYGLGWPAAVDEVMQLVPMTWPTLAVVELPVAAGPSYLAWALVVAGEARDVKSAWHRVRSRLLFALAPLAAFWVAGDLAVLALWTADVGATAAQAEVARLVAGLIVAVAIAPWLVVRTLPTRPMPAGEASDDLIEFARRLGLRRPRLRVWDTGHSAANALAVGFLPRPRYVLLSDLLLAGLDGPRRRAVLAHEVGHLRHRHALWLLLIFAAIALFLAGPFDAAARLALGDAARVPAWLDWAVTVAVAGGTLLGFGFVSRRFERQADWFAVRAMGGGEGGSLVFADALATAILAGGGGLVGPGRPRGLADAGGAAEWLLHAAGDFLHGSFETRAAHAATLASDPRAARRFDRRMLALRLTTAAIAAGSVPFLVLP